jgi:hypothetical protein
MIFERAHLSGMPLRDPHNAPSGREVDHQRLVPLGPHGHSGRYGICLFQGQPETDFSIQSTATGQ